MKKVLSLLFILSFASIIFSQIRIGILNGPSCIPVAYMMENFVSIQNDELEYTKFPDAKSIVPKLVKEEIDVGFLPVNLAAKLYTTGNKKILCVAITGQGNISLITKDLSINSLADLKGKKVNIAGQGATPDFMFRYLLEANGISYENPEDTQSVMFDYSIPTAQLASQIIANKITYAVVPQPFSTIAKMKDNLINEVIDFQKEYKTINPNQENYPLTVMVVTRKFAEEKTEELNQLLQLYKESFEYILDNALETGYLCEKFDLGLTSKVVANSIPYANYVFIPARDGKEQVEKMLSLFLTQDPSTIGGNLPDENFYY